MSLFDTPKKRYTWLAVIWLGLPLLMVIVALLILNDGEGSFLFWLVILMTPSISLRFGIAYGLIALGASALLVRRGMKDAQM